MTKKMTADEALNALMDYMDGNENAFDGYEETDIIHPVHGKLISVYSVPWSGWFADVWKWEDGFEEIDFDTSD